MDSPHGKANWVQIFSVTLILLLTAEVILLIKQNRDLKNSLRGTSQVAEIEPLQPGERIEPTRVQMLDGTVTDLTFNDASGKYLLFVLSTTCPHCEKTLVNWKQIVSENHRKRCTIIGLSIHDLDETIKYISKQELSFYLASVSVDTSFTRKYKLSGVPETILVTGDGIVEKVWVGELSDEQTKEIETLAGL